ncbi:VanZ family protein [Arthrobacter sp. TWP1-1]|uniref:VanZ family protein n=1 Tax=Arthrobacter sp. TWP1-1 TaxID=2804568 RepID=UPI003CEDF308
MNKPHHQIANAATLVYLVGVVLVVFWPTPVDRPASGQLHMILDWLHQHGMPIYIGYNKVEFASNIAMFIPTGYIAATWFKNVGLGVIIGALASCLIELSQCLFLPERYATGLDVLANTIGAGIGAALYYVVHRLYRLRLPDPQRPRCRNLDDAL